MLNNHELRQKFKRIKQNSLLWLFMASLITGMAILTLVLTCTLCHAEISTEDAIRSVAGEGEGESYLGKIALSATLYNRGTLKGVSAYKNVVVRNGVYYKRVSLKSKYYKRTGNRLRPIPMQAVIDARKAWKYILINGVGDWKATGWGTKEDVAIFKHEGWFKNCAIVGEVGKHFFYMVKP